MIKDIQNTSITVYRPALSNDRYDKPISVNITDEKMLTLSSSVSYSVELPGAIDERLSNAIFGKIAFTSTVF